jgi:hypothetical protein
MIPVDELIGRREVLMLMKLPRKNTAREAAAYRESGFVLRPKGDGRGKAHPGFPLLPGLVCSRRCYLLRRSPHIILCRFSAARTPICQIILKVTRPGPTAPGRVVRTALNIPDRELCLESASPTGYKFPIRNIRPPGQERPLP